MPSLLFVFFSIPAAPHEGGEKWVGEVSLAGKCVEVGSVCRCELCTVRELFILPVCAVERRRRRRQDWQNRDLILADKRKGKKRKFHDAGRVVGGGPCMPPLGLSVLVWSQC